MVYNQVHALSLYKADLALLSHTVHAEWISYTFQFVFLVLR